PMGTAAQDHDARVPDERPPSGVLHAGRRPASGPEYGRPRPRRYRHLGSPGGQDDLSAAYTRTDSLTTPWGQARNDHEGSRRGEDHDGNVPEDNWGSRHLTPGD